MAIELHVTPNGPDTPKEPLSTKNLHERWWWRFVTVLYSLVAVVGSVAIIAGTIASISNIDYTNVGALCANGQTIDPLDYGVILFSVSDTAYDYEWAKIRAGCEVLNNPGDDDDSFMLTYVHNPVADNSAMDQLLAGLGGFVAFWLLLIGVKRATIYTLTGQK